MICSGVIPAVGSLVTVVVEVGVMQRGIIPSTSCSEDIFNLLNEFTLLATIIALGTNALHCGKTVQTRVKMIEATDVSIVRVIFNIFDATKADKLPGVQNRPLEKAIHQPQARYLDDNNFFSPFVS